MRLHRSNVLMLLASVCGRDACTFTSIVRRVLEIYGCNEGDNTLTQPTYSYEVSCKYGPPSQYDPSSLTQIEASILGRSWRFLFFILRFCLSPHSGSTPSIRLSYIGSLPRKKTKRPQAPFRMACSTASCIVIPSYCVDSIQQSQP